MIVTINRIPVVDDDIRQVVARFRTRLSEFDDVPDFIMINPDNLTMSRDWNEK